jgi:hypothetical protein
MTTNTLTVPADPVPAEVTFRGRHLRARAAAFLLLSAAALCAVGCGGGSSSDGTGSTNTTGSSSSGTACGYQDATYTNTAYLAVLSGSVTQADETYTATADDESGVCVSGSGATLTLTNPTIVTSGKSLDTDYSSFYGLDAGALAYTGGALSIAGGSISTSGQGANGVFVYGPGASAIIKDVTIIATADNGHGLEAAGGGSLAIENVTATSSGASSSVVATDRGDGNTVTVTGGAYTANGFRSAAVYSTGAMTLADATLTANAAEGVVVEGFNSVTLTNCALSSTNSSENRGVFVYQSMSGDASTGTGTFTMTGGSYTWNSSSSTSAAFYITNTTAAISLTNAAVMNPTGYLLHAEANQWGASGSNGGNVTFTASGETLSGDIVADEYSTVAAALTNSSTYTGAINSANTAKTMAVALDSSSTWNVSTSSYVTALTGVVLSGSTATNVVGSSAADVCYKTSFTDANGTTHTSGTYALTGGGSLNPCS